MRYSTILMLAAFSAAALPARSAPSAHLTNVLYAGGTLKIHLSAPARFSTTPWLSAKRYSVDISASDIDLRLRALPVNAGNLKGVRWNQWKPGVVRVVLDLASAEAPVLLSRPPADVIELRVAGDGAAAVAAETGSTNPSEDPQSASQLAAEIGAVVVDNDDAGRPSRVTVRTSAAVVPKGVWYGNHLSLEMADTVPCDERIVPLNDAVVLRVRTGTYAGHGRVVVDARRRFAYKLQSLEDGCGFTLDLLLTEPAPNPEPDAPLTGEGLKGKLVVLDPGHGGHDFGARGPWMTEKSANLDIALRLKQVLEKAGARVEMTRSDDTFVALQSRPALAMRLKADAFVSIHCNQAYSLAAGTEVFYRRNDSESRRLATCLYEAHRAQTGLSGRKVKPDSGAPQGGLAVLKHNEVPCALVEVAFMNNPDEGRKLADPAWRESVAEGLGKGLERYMEGRD